MAPYALTPTVEHSELQGGGWNLPAEPDSLNGGTPATSSDGNSTSSQPTHQVEELNGASSPSHSCPNGATTPKSTASFEDAYVHGYKEGYTSGFTKAHVDLKHQPIAIIGMSCRLPGSVSTPDEFWELLARSRTGFTEIPASRFSANRFHHSNPGKSGTTNARGGNCKLKRNSFKHVTNQSSCLSSHTRLESVRRTFLRLHPTRSNKP